MQTDRTRPELLDQPLTQGYEHDCDHGFNAECPKGITSITFFRNWTAWTRSSTAWRKRFRPPSPIGEGSRLDGRGRSLRARLCSKSSPLNMLSLLRGVTRCPLSSPRPAARKRNQSAPTIQAACPLRRGLTRAWRWSLAKVRGFGQRSRLSPGQHPGWPKPARTFSRVNTVWELKRPLVITLLVGFLAGLWLRFVAVAGRLVSGVSATGALLGMQLAPFARRLFAGFHPCRSAARRTATLDGKEGFRGDGRSNEQDPRTGDGSLSPRGTISETALEPQALPISA